MGWKRTLIAVLGAAAIILAGCAGATGEEDVDVDVEETASPVATPSSPLATPSSPLATPEVDSTPGREPPPPSISEEVPGEIVDAAQVWLSTELGVSPDEITTLSGEAVDWPDTSLGCPQPGMMYAQVISPGYLLRFEVGGQTYEVHTDRTGGVFVMCP